MLQTQSYPTVHRTIGVDGLEIFYREAGPKDAPVIALLHGFPTSSHMFRKLIPALSDKFRVVAPDYPGFGNSTMPSSDEFEYSFARLAEVVDHFLEGLRLDEYSLYLMDYGAPVGYRIAVKHPERVESLIVQNGNAYGEGLRDFWEPIKAYWNNKSAENAKVLRDNLLTIEATKWQYTHSVPNPEAVAPDNWLHDQYLLDRPGNKEIQLELFNSYGTNPPLYLEWQAYIRRHQPPTLVAWGKHDYIFPADGAHPYKRDLKDIEFHLLDAGHFALESKGEEVAGLIRDFVSRKVAPAQTCAP